MRTDEYIIGLRKNHGITVSLEGGELKVRAYQKSITKEVLEGLKARKPEIITFLESVSQNDTDNGIPLAPKQDYYKASSAQKRLYFIHELDRRSLAYHRPVMLNAKGKLDSDKLTKALNQLLDRHESLRTSFKIVDEEVYQTIAERETLVLEQFEGNRSDVESIFKTFVRPFDLTQGPLIRVGLMPLAPEENVLMIDMHHIICDGISQGILIKDFMALYNGEPLPELKFQYKDYVAWQQTEAQQRALNEYTDYWLAEFSDETETLELPTDFARPPRKNYQGGSVSFTINQEKTLSLKCLADEGETTLFTVLLSVFYVLLSKLSNQEDIVIGTPVAGRQHEDLEPIIGMFVNTLPLRNYPESDLSFARFLSNVKTGVLKGFDNQAIQYESLISELNLERDTSRNPLFDVMFAFQNMEEVALEIPGLILEPIRREQAESKFDLMLTAYETTEGISLSFEYSTQLFRAETIERFITYFGNVVSAVTDDPNKEIATIEILTTAEKQQILSEFNKPITDNATGINVINLFRQQALKTPENTALINEDLRLSYIELDRLSDNIAAYLKEKEGVKQGDLVGLLLEREAYLVPLIFGVLKAGAAYVPMDPDYPQDRVHAIIRDSGMKWVITRTGFIEKLAGSDSKNIDLDQSLSSITSFEGKPLETDIQDKDLAYVIYTSGSTGKPKGVMIEHHSIANVVRYLQRICPLNESDSYLFKTTYVFDVSCAEIFGWYHNGGSLTVLPAGAETDPEVIFKTIRDHRVSHVNFVPSMFSALVEELEVRGTESMDSLKYVILAGEALPVQLVKRFRQLGLKNAALWNIYGPTEATVYGSAYDTAPLNPKSVSVPIGKPIDNGSLYVLNKGNNLQPVGVPGELHIGGAGVARGYIGDEKLTNEKIVPNSITGEGRLYKTGDLVKWLPDGNVAYLGRIDHQVKIRGFRIELGEIESHLLTHDLIEEAAVVAKDKNEDRFLVAYYVSSEELETSLLKRYLSEHLPVYMVPAYFVHLTALPLTANGKLNRKALPDPEIQAGEVLVLPETREERLLAEVWSAVLGVKTIGVTENFFSLGGDSIKSIQISSRMRNAGFEVTVQNIFTHQTIQELAPNLKTLVTASDQSAVEGIAMLSPVQHWFLNGSLASKHHYNQSILLNFPEGLSAQDARVLFYQLQTHHDALRMCFRRESDTWIQENQSLGLSVSIKERDLRGLADSDEELTQEASQIQEGIDLEKGPLVKLGLFHMQDGSRLLIVIHHLVVDGVSWRILFEDLEHLYRQLKNKEAFSLPLKTDAFLKWPSVMEKYTESESFQKVKAYWDRQHLQNVDKMERDGLSGRSSQESARKVSFRLTEEITKQLLTEVHAAFNTKINDVLLAALWLAAHKQFGHEMVKVDLEGHGREPVDPAVNISRTVGWFTSIYPVILTGGEGTLSDVIKEVKESLRQVPNNGFDYLLYQQKCLSENEHESSQMVFNYLGQTDSDTEGRSFTLADESHGAPKSPTDSLEYDWSIEGIVMQGRLEMTLVYGAEQYHYETVTSFMRHYEHSLKSLIDYCRDQEQTELTPSDLTYKRLSMPQLNKLQEQYVIEDIYPLSPMQEAMLFHSLINTDTDEFFQQLRFDLKGPVDIDALQRSMNDLISRYEVLRTAFLHEGYPRSLQVVLKNREIDVFFANLSKSSTTDKESLVEEYRQRDVSYKFDLATDALMRLTVLKTSETQHILIWSHHHILMDGWCMSIVFSELMAMYKGHLQGTLPLLPPVHKYSNYITWLEEQDEQASMGYWKAYLSGYENLATIPAKASLSNSTEHTYDLKSEVLLLDQSMTSLLISLSVDYGVTLNTIIQTSWALLLARYNNTQDVVFGAVVSGRPPQVEGVENMIGLFINGIPVRISFNEGDTLGTILKDVQEKAITSEPYHYSPLASVQQLSELGRDLLDHIFILVNYPTGKEIAGRQDSNTGSEGLNVTSARLFEQTNYDLAIFVVTGETIEIRFDYNAEKYDQRVMEGISRHMENILRQITSNAELPWSEVDILSLSERFTLLNTFNDTFSDFPSEKTLIQLFEAQVGQTPASTAVIHNGVTLSYQELYQRATKLGTLLQACGLGSNDHVALYMPRSIHMLTSILGVFYARAAYVPIDVDYPQERVTEILLNSEAGVVIVEEDQVGRLEKIKSSLPELKKVIVVDQLDPETIEVTAPAEGNPDDLAYIIYTSGTTGKPKGVMIRQLGMINHLFAKINDLSLNHRDVIAQTASPCFDISVWQFLAALLVGGRTHIIDSEEVLEPQRLIASLERGKVSIFESVPSLITTFLDGLPEGKINLLRDLRWMIPTGEALSKVLVKKWYTYFPEIKLLNAYGPTEASDDVTHYAVPEPDEDQLTISIGKPVQNTHIYILDKNLKLCPVGVQGEICVAGLGIGRGYWKDAEKTSKAFVPNPFRDEIEAKGYDLLYKTGDIGYLEPDGNIICLGRVDHQVKIRGNRIELGEIETVLNEAEGIMEVAVVAKGSESSKSLVAYYTSMQELDHQELRRHLFARLPEYMVPSYFIPMSEFPLTHNGKLDRKALPDPDVKTSDSFEAPANEIEEKLAKVWSDVLGLDQVGVTDNFFTIGGDSIKSIMIGSRMRDLRYKVRVQDIFAYPTIRQLASSLEANAGLSHQGMVHGWAHLSPMQHWLLAGPMKSESDNSRLVLLDFPERIFKEDVKYVFEQIQTHHDALRITFQQNEAEWTQSISETLDSVALEERNLIGSKKPETAIAEEAMSIQSGTDLANGPLMKLGLFHVADRSHLLIVIHHLLMDEMSWRILLEDIDTLFEQRKKAEAFSLAPKTDSFISWPSRLEAYLKTDTYRKAIQHWKDLETTEAASLERNYPAITDSTNDIGQVSFQLDTRETQQLQTEVLQPFNTRIEDMLLVALCMSLEKQFGKGAYKVDIRDHSRETVLSGVDMSRTVGCLSSVYPVLFSGNSKELGGLIKEVKEYLRKVPNGGLDYMLYRQREDTEQARDSQILFNYLKPLATEVELKSFSVSDMPQDTIQAQGNVLTHDWSITGITHKGQLKMSIGYYTAQFDEQTMLSFIGLYEESLQELIAYCRGRSTRVFTPSDLTYKALTIAQTDALQQSYSIEDIYPLSPMQEGMLYHSVLEPDISLYLGQITCQVRGRLEIKAIEESMNRLMGRYDILRTVFLHQGYERSLQIVLKERSLEFSYEDLRETLLTENKEELVRSRQEEERSRVFDLSEDVLMRLIVLQTGDDEYEFIWCYHHILMDGWCMNIIVSEFQAIYAGLIRGDEVYLPAVKPYSGYIKWLESRESSISADYWLEYLSAYDTLVSFPGKETLVEDPVKKMDRCRLLIDQEHTTMLHELSGKYGVTLNTIFQAAWSLLLARYNHTTDVVFGAVVSGRPAEVEGIEYMVGLFITTIPVRVKLSGSDQLGELLRRIQSGGLESEPHHYHSLSEIQALSELGDELFNHIVTFENLPDNKPLEDLPFEIGNNEFRADTPYEMVVTVLPYDAMEITFDYDSSLFSDETMAELMHHLKQLIRAIGENPEATLSELSIFTPEKQHRLREEYSCDLTTVSGGTTLQQLLSESFDKYGDRTALEYVGDSFTYQQLEERTDQIARLLSSAELTESSPVGILCQDRSLFICAMLAALKARMVFVPFEVTLPEVRLAYMIEQSGTSLIITDQDAAVRNALGYGVGLNWLTAEVIEQEEPGLLSNLPVYETEDQIYIYFTSGSTGQPKGVIGKNKSLVHFVNWEISEFGIDETFRVSQFTNPGFDAILRDIFVPLCTGATICVPDDEVLSSGKDIARWIDTEKISLIHSVPSFFKLFQKNDLTDNQLQHLKYILLAGEKILPYELESWYRQHGNKVQLVNLYGTTETTLIKGHYLIQPEDIRRTFIPVRAISGAQFMVLDSHLNVCPTGVTGEIYIRTPYRSAGYLNREALNNTSFISNPLSTITNDLIYKTGDLGRMDSDGALEILGRSDQQVKVRGVRIELDEIKANLLQYEGLTDAIVATRATEEDEKVICAYLLMDTELVQDDLRVFLSSVLPKNMVPTYLIPVDEFPLLPNGKIDRKALKEVDLESTSEHVEAANPTEEKLVEIWSEVTKMEPESISTTRSFFEMGAHSLKLLLFMNRINKEFQIKIPLMEIFNNVSVQAMAVLISNLKKEKISQIPRVAEKEFYRASPAQERMYYQHLLHKESTAYNISMPVEIKGDVDINKLNQSFQALIDRHEGLRTSFRLSKDGVIQKIHPTVKFELELIEANQYKTVDEAYAAFIRPFDLAAESLLRGGLFGGQSGNYLFVDIHHLIADRISLEILINDFNRAYHGETLKPTEIRYVDYATWLNDNNEKLETQRTFWSSKLSGSVPRTDLPTLQERETVDTRRVAYKELVIDEKVYQELKRFTATYQASDFMLLLSAYYILLQKMSGSADITIGSEVLGRTHPDLKEIVGTFVNIVPLRVQPSPEKTYIDFLTEVREVVLDAFENQDFQFDRMIELVGEQEGSERNPIFDYYFSYDRTEDNQETTDELKFIPYDTDKQVRGDYEFTIDAVDVKGRLTLTFIYSSELFDEETIDLFMYYYQAILTDVMSNETKSIEDINLESALEQMS